MERRSYEKIMASHAEVKKWTFFSDNVAEVGAAIEAGMRAVVVQRPGNADLTEEQVEGLTVLKTFEGL